MKHIRFAKLVRDGALRGCLENPLAVTHHRTLDDMEFKAALLEKVHEEAAEIPVMEGATDEVLAELADWQGVVDELRRAYNLSAEDVAVAQQRKRDKKGGFEGRAYIDSVEANDQSEWIEILAQ